MMNLWQAAWDYWVDATQRTVLFWDVMRKRGNMYLEHEAAGARARTFLLERAPGADVVVLSQHDADRRLIEHARRADLIAIATKAAKHAATIEIEKQRKPESTVVYPTGKGWSSLVGALREGCRALE